MESVFPQLKQSVQEGRKAFQQTEAARILESHKKDNAFSTDERKLILEESHRCLSDLEVFLRESYPSLTDEDIELCLLSALKCKPKTCSNCLTVSEEAIRVRKHRLKDKLPHETMNLVWEERKGTRLLKTLFMKDTMQNVWQRFPLTVVYLILRTAGCIVAVWWKIPESYENLVTTILFSLFLGLILTSATTLWSEEVKNRSARLWGIVIGNILLVLNAFFIYKHLQDDPPTAMFIAQAAITTALAVAFFYLPFFREKDDLPVWNFTWRTFLWFCISFLTGGILAGGLIILMRSLDMLFGISVNEDWYATIGILSILTVPVLLFLARIPEGEEKHSDVAVISKFLFFVIRYLFIPLLLLYLIVLYIYGIHILIRWELPNGGVAWLVSVLMIGCVIVELCLYPFMRSGEGKPFEKWIVRWLPVLILPLLLLMTIGIARRLSDYGVTHPRLYLLVFNLWCYAVCLGLFFGKAKRVRWIATSFATVSLLTSLLPINLTSLSVKIRKKAFCQLVENTLPASLPMDDTSAKEWLKSIEDKEVKKKIRNELYFFKKTDSKALKEIMSASAVDELGYASYSNSYESSSEDSSDKTTIIDWWTEPPLSIPEGYSKMWERSYFYRKMKDINESGFWVVNMLDEKDKERIFIDMETLKSIKKEDDSPRFFSADSTYVFVAKHFHLCWEKDSTLSESSSIQGFIFGK